MCVKLIADKVVIIGYIFEAVSNNKKLDQYPLPGTLVCVLIKLVVISEFNTRTNMVSKLWRLCPSFQCNMYYM